jgi:putative ABC transport system permease protein
VRNVQIDEGSFITEANTRSISKVAVLGPTARDDLFGVGAEAVGQTIRIKNNEFKVVGVTKVKGGSSFGSQDDMIFIPLSTAQRFLAGDVYVTTISVQATDANGMADIQQQITDLLLSRHHISDPTLADFSTLNQSDIIATASSITGTFTILLAAIAGISLVVGGIGIMNMMLTTVTERTREIGLRKAIGAKRADISTQFLVEAVMLTFIGGAIGVLLGWGISFGITYFGILQTKVSLSSVLLAFGVSAGIGIVFGYYPARRAAAMNPIEALRYE